LRQATAVAGDNAILSARIDRFAQAFRYAELEVAKMSVFTKDWIFEETADHSYHCKPYYKALLSEFVQKCKKYGPKTLHETKIPPGEYLTTTQKYFEEGVETHLALGADLKFAQPWSSAYPAFGEKTLIDGVHGFDKWETMWQGWWGEDITATIDLRSEKEIRALKIACMDDQQSWILAPQWVRFEVSMDGVDYKELGVVRNATAAQKIDKQIIPFALTLVQAERARFVRVVVKNIGQMPKWRGVDGKAWLFADEIVIK
jgi:hypothetical protein